MAHTKIKALNIATDGSLTNESGNLSVNVVAGGGISKSGSGISVLKTADGGIDVGVEGIFIKLASTDKMSVGASGLDVKVDGASAAGVMKSDANGINLNYNTQQFLCTGNALNLATSITGKLHAHAYERDLSVATGAATLANTPKLVQSVNCMGASLIKASSTALTDGDWYWDSGTTLNLHTDYNSMKVDVGYTY